MRKDLKRVIYAPAPTRLEGGSHCAPQTCTNKNKTGHESRRLYLWVPGRLGIWVVLSVAGLWVQGALWGCLPVSPSENSRSSGSEAGEAGRGHREPCLPWAGEGQPLWKSAWRILKTKLEVLCHPTSPSRHLPESVKSMR